MINVFSGGGSALLVQPAGGLTLDDLQKTNQAMLASGADITLVNTIRKHLSAVKGGQLATACSPVRRSLRQPRDGFCRAPLCRTRPAGQSGRPSHHAPTSLATRRRRFSLRWRSVERFSLRSRFTDRQPEQTTTVAHMPLVWPVGWPC